MELVEAQQDNEGSTADPDGQEGLSNATEPTTLADESELGDNGSN